MSKTSMLSLFNDISKLNPKYKIKPREIEQRFKENIISQLNELIIADVNNPELIKQIFTTNIPNSLQSFLENILNNLQFQNAQDLQQKMEQIKLFNSEEQQLQKFVAIQDLLRLILNNSYNKQILEQSLWLSYLQEPEQATCDVLKHKRLDSCGDQYYQQVQADPPKRAGYILFSTLFHLLDQLIYIKSEGKVRLSFQDYESGPGEEENALQKLWRIQTGNALTPPVAPKPSS